MRVHCIAVWQVHQLTKTRFQTLFVDDSGALPYNYTFVKQ
jgi:hypothetical protein